MPLTTAQQVRTRINDRWRYDEEFLYADGTASGWRLRQGSPFSTLSAVSAYVALPAPTGWSATGTTVDTDLGRLYFTSALTANTPFRVDYQWAVFSDDEIGFFTAQGGDVNGAALQAVQTLMFDNLKRARWSSPDGTSYDDTKSMADLRAMYDLLRDAQQGGPEGGLESWGENQAYWSTEYNA